MAILSDDFSVDVGQIDTHGFDSNPTMYDGTAVITSGQLVLAVPTSPNGSVITYVSAGENPWTVSTPANTFIWAVLGSPALTPNLGQNNFGVGVVKDGNNWAQVQCGFIGAGSTTLNIFASIMVGGVRNTVASTSLNVSALGTPDKIGFGLVNNTITCYLSFSGTWRKITTFGSSGNVDVSPYYDFTVSGSLTGWLPAFTWGVVAASSQSAACDFMQFIEPFASPITGTTVPDVLTETLSSASADILAANLIVGSVTTSIDAATPGTVISQTPTGGASAGIGTAVDLVLSAGEATVPDVVTELQAAAESDILAANCTVGTVTFQSNPATAGTVISQTPAGGTSVAIGTPVNIVVSSVANRSIYGKFVGSATYPPVLFIDAPEIEPRVWMPKENVTVKS